MDIKKILLVIGIIIIILVATMLILLNIISEDSILPKDLRGRTIHEDEEEIQIIYNELEKVKNKEEFFTVKACAENYINEVYYKENQKIYNLLSEQYIMLNQITVENVLSKVDVSEDPQILDIEIMYKVRNSDTIITYYLEGTIKPDLYEEETTAKKINMAIKLDVVTRTFAVIPDEQKPDANNIPVDTTKEIKENENNTYVSRYISDEQLAEIYFTRYIANAQEQNENAYYMLEEEYRKKRFPTKDDLDKYIQSLGDSLYSLNVEKVDILEGNGINTYTITDQLGNSYIFKETAIMEYTVKLDNYTLNSDEFLEKYQKANNMEKGMMNIDKFLEMLNMRDYEAIYNILNDKFKANNFDTIDKLKDYIESKIANKFILVNKEKRSNISGSYVYSAKIKEVAEDGFKEKEINIVMEILEGTDFKISFTI